MNLKSYIFTVNKSHGCTLDESELKDVVQDAQIILSQKDYNDHLVRLTIRSVYRGYVDKKVKARESVQDLAHHLQSMDDGIDLEIEQSRQARVEKLEVSKLQKKILQMLISGAEYSEVRKKLRLNRAQLAYQLKLIKANNSVK